MAHDPDLRDALLALLVIRAYGPGPVRTGEGIPGFMNRGAIKKAKDRGWLEKTEITGKRRVKGKYPKYTAVQLTEKGLKALAAEADHQAKAVVETVRAKTQLRNLVSGLTGVIEALDEEPLDLGVKPETSETEEVTEQSFGTPVHPDPGPLTQIDVGVAILDAFNELLRDKYHHTELVPIPEVRFLVRQRCGVLAAGHDIFDRKARELADQRRLYLTAISDLRKATPEQLAEGIPGMGETIYYMEPVE